MENKKEKIIFVLYPVKDDYDRIESYIGLSSYIERSRGIGLKRKDVTNKIKELVKEDVEEGLHKIDDAFIFVLPLEFTRLHTQQHPLVVLKGMNEIVDIDEYWYTPFKKIIFNASKYEFTADNENWRHDECVEWALDSGYLVRFKINPDDSEWLYGIRTNNITFDMDR